MGREGSLIDMQSIAREVVTGRIKLGLRRCVRNEVPQMKMTSDGKKVVCQEEVGSFTFKSTRSKSASSDEWIIDCGQINCPFYNGEDGEIRQVNVVVK